jgi:peptidoglycan/LPS O-acetylase OafA/YrhL
VAESKSTERIPELDGLRGFAVLAVVLWHYFYFFPAQSDRPTGFLRAAHAWFERSIATGWSGVDLFFVLSGFLIGGILLDARESPRYFKTFYLRRFYRIIPIYYLWISWYIILSLSAKPLLSAIWPELAMPWSWREMLGRFLFLQNLGFIGASAGAFVWLAPTWSLAVEEQFYLVAPLAIRFLSKRNLYAALCTAIVGAPLLRVFVSRGLATPLTLDPAYVLMPCRADALAIGVFAAMLWREPRMQVWMRSRGQILTGFSVILLAGVVALTRWSPNSNSLSMRSVGYTWFALFYGSTLLLVVSRRAGIVARLARMKWLRELGRVSYCVYLIHEVVKLFCGAAVHAAVGNTARTDLATSLIAGAVTYALARVSWVYFENPLLRRGHSYRY